MSDTSPQPEPGEPSVPETSDDEAEPPGRARGVPLTILLVLLTLGQLVGTVLLVSVLAEDVDHGRYTLPAALLVLLGLVALVGIVGIWGWQRWGVVVFAVAAVIGFVTDVTLGGLPPGTIAVRVVLVVATFVLIRQRWASFT